MVKGGVYLFMGTHLRVAIWDHSHHTVIIPLT